jgi:5'-nucleotidase (lipoprotein e(P4) family)
MKLKILSAALLSTLLLSACIKQKTTDTGDQVNNDRLLMAVSWFEHSGEMEALYYQGFNIAKMRLDEALAVKKTDNKPLAVVVDIDETMLDNSPFETMLIDSSDNLSGWQNWTSKASAKALPGALEFAKYAESKNVEVYYITNRDDNERLVTLKNLVNEGFPYASENHLFTKSDTAYSSGNTSSKAARRAKVAENHEIILLIGDNLNDFSEVFEDRSKNDGRAAVEQNREEFGKKFIILPNPIYGAWEKPLYDYRDGLNDKEKTDQLKAKLKR